MINSRDLNSLLMPAQSRATVFIACCELQIPGIKIIVSSTFRDDESQNELYKIGRRGVAGERIVTNAKGGDSFHQYRIAFDIFPVRWGKPIFGEQDGDEVRDPIWQTIGQIGREAGLEWAGDWKTFKEAAHFQYTGGLTLIDLKNGLRPTE